MPKSFANCKFTPFVGLQVASFHYALILGQLPQMPVLQWNSQINHLGTVPAKRKTSGEGFLVKSESSLILDFSFRHLKAKSNYALHNRSNFDHCLAARTGLGLHDGQLHLYSSGRRHHHDSGAAHPREKSLGHCVKTKKNTSNHRENISYNSQSTSN
jgi:hypothetical protein